MRDDTKLARIREAMANAEWELALKLAAKFQRLGPQREAIKRAAEAISHPDLYEQLGYDLTQLREQGIRALKERYSNSWNRANETDADSG